MNLGMLISSLTLGMSLGLILTFKAGKRRAITSQPAPLNNDLVTFDFAIEAPGFIDFVVKRWDDNNQLQTEDVPRSEEGELLVESDLADSPNLSECPCGLVLPEASMWEHLLSTGHSGISSLGRLKMAKIWDLEEAMIEQTSPDCYKCGKPVQGLKRLGKTIYVRHVGCMNSARTEKDRAIDYKSRAKLLKRDSPVTLETCPICWKSINRPRGFTEVASPTGKILKFHDYCLTLQS